VQWWGVIDANRRQDEGACIVKTPLVVVAQTQNRISGSDGSPRRSGDEDARRVIDRITDPLASGTERHCGAPNQLRVER
jgi:hypothetical protein